MSTTGQKIPYTAALATAQALESRLAFVCERTLIAGSLRRRKAEIGDIELVVMPKTEPTFDMFGTVVGQRSLLDDVLLDIAPQRTKDGQRFKQFVWEGISVDLFIATPETWGCVATIRTGSAAFTKWLVTKKRYGGACPEMYDFKEGRLWALGAPLDTREELAVFAFLELDWVAPIERTDDWRPQ